MDPENITLSEANQKIQGPYDFTQTWDMKLKATSEQTHRHEQYGGYEKGGGCGGGKSKGGPTYGDGGTLDCGW